MYTRIFAVILLVLGLINGYLLLFKYPKDFQSSKVIHSFLTVCILLAGMFFLIYSFT
jgi:hypothetical protein